MTYVSKRLPFVLLILFSIGYFCLFSLPNAAGSQDTKMVLIFQPDEAVPLPYLLDMLKPSDTLKQALINFAFYDYYFYGYPYFAISALAILPLKWFNQLGNTTLVMWFLRQMISVLPILASIWILVYLHTRLKTYRAVVLFVLLASIPAVVKNNLWWHPDGLAILFAMCALLFLDLDKLRFGRFYYLAAAMCGFSAGTKGIGFYFFLAVFVYLVMGYASKKIRLPKLVLAAAGFVLVMFGAYLLGNPILIFAGIRRRYFEVMREQSEFLTQGYEVFYPTGFAAAWPDLTAYYGGWPILLAALLAGLWGIWRGANRLLNILTLAWFLPMTVLVLTAIHFKFQYWLPVALPFIAMIGSALPDPERVRRMFTERDARPFALLAQEALILVVVGQLVGYGVTSSSQYRSSLHREQTSDALVFYQLASERLAPLPPAAYFVYHEVRMYVPESAGWVTESIFEVLTYPFIESRNFQIVMVMQERINDYLNPDVQAIDPSGLALAREFYRDANQGQLRGYRLVFRNAFGLVFVRDDLYNTYDLTGTVGRKYLGSNSPCPPDCLKCSACDQ